ncbi:hypothetical protein CDAR_569281 [Caerostris darwini]|uniref:Uncharacterized protein n=1 Tax=Caerostris darwini TaxID=1538125 RepID=A0AAV4NNJ8_9ARAC|nr:hypothetical protein CDAR_569281 [Caerostris darwini]
MPRQKRTLKATLVCTPSQPTVLHPRLEKKGVGWKDTRSMKWSCVVGKCLCVKRTKDNGDVSKISYLVSSYRLEEGLRTTPSHATDEQPSIVTMLSRVMDAWHLLLYEGVNP